jgi:mono/diheme cytochrome c family protein
MKKRILPYAVFCSLSVLFVLTQFSCKPSSAKEELSKEELIARGKYLATTGGCNDCHTPKVFTQAGMEFDTTRLFAGYTAGESLPKIDTTMVTPGKWYLANSHLTGWVGPWGISYAANLSPHEATGIGNWTEEIFIKSLRTGKHMGVGRPILPPMPWQTIGQMTDEDLSAILAYLKSLPAINNKVPDPVPPNMVGSYIKEQANKSTAKL